MSTITAHLAVGRTGRGAHLALAQAKADKAEAKADKAEKKADKAEDKADKAKGKK